jgi:hypothetical protein
MIGSDGGAPGGAPRLDPVDGEDVRALVSHVCCHDTDSSPRQHLISPNNRILTGNFTIINLSKTLLV